MNNQHPNPLGFTRRSFLSALGTLFPYSEASPAPAPPSAPRSLSLPHISLGRFRISRLIAGGNPMRGFSHSSAKLSRHMLEYFTPERIAQFLLTCQHQGITAFQSSYSDTVRDGVQRARDQGCSIHFLCLSSPRHATFEQVLPLKPIAISHHGAVTDPLFREGKHQQVHDYVKKVHDLGLLAGVSTHDPDNLARMEDWGWEVDFYMTCFYNLTRTRDELRQLLGGEEVLGEVFLRSDPERMTRRIREVGKPCLAFKILAAGRLAEDRKTLEEAFAYAFRSIKPSDAVIVGMYPVFSDEVAEDAELTRRYGVASGRVS